MGGFVSLPRRVLCAGVLCLAVCSPLLAAPAGAAEATAAVSAEASAAAQDYLAQARQLATSGQRPAAIKVLQDRLATRADDADAMSVLLIILLL